MSQRLLQWGYRRQEVEEGKAKQKMKRTKRTKRTKRMMLMMLMLTLVQLEDGRR